MTDNHFPSVAVIAGLAVGIAVVILFSMIIRSDSLLSDEELIARYSKIPEVKYFLSKYPDATVNVDRWDYGKHAVGVSLMTERQVYPPSDDEDGRHSFYMSVTSRPLLPPSMLIGCGYGHVSGETPLMNIDMIDSMAQGCFTPQP
jgi:hypothetical protein